MWHRTSLLSKGKMLRRHTPTGEEAATKSALDVIKYHFQTAWAAKGGITFDDRMIEIREVHGGFGLFTKPVLPDGLQAIEPGEMLVVVPSKMALQSSALDHRLASSLDTAAQSRQMSEEEKRWWGLTLAVCQEVHKGTDSRFSGYLSHCLPKKSPIDAQQIFLDYSAEPGVDIQRLASFLTKLDDEVNEMTSLCQAHAGTVFSGEGSGVPAKAAVRWAYDMVRSRANNFSFDGSTAKLRPYGLYDAPPPPGALPTMCPYFDMMNHKPMTNVLVADVVVEGDAKEGSGSSDSCLVIGALVPLPVNTQLCYCYNAPRLPEVPGSSSPGKLPPIDKEQCLVRWGFLPQQPQ